jgi:ribosomal protein S18 acetylase RimI-like enzyme
MRYVIRAAVPGDAVDLGHVHVRAWREAYGGGLMPDDYLDGLSEQGRASMWRQSLENATPSRTARLVGASDDATVVGFAVVGPAGGDRDAQPGELYAINVDPEHWGAGVGAELLAAAIEALQAAEFSAAHLWVHPANGRARAFYEARGWRSDGVEREQEVLGVTVPEVRYSISF